jgi:hypothetical protein
LLIHISLKILSYFLSSVLICVAVTKVRALKKGDDLQRGFWD